MYSLLCGFVNYASILSLFDLGLYFLIFYGIVFFVGEVMSNLKIKHMNNLELNILKETILMIREMSSNCRITVTSSAKYFVNLFPQAYVVLADRVGCGDKLNYEKMIRQLKKLSNDVKTLCTKNTDALKKAVNYNMGELLEGIDNLRNDDERKSLCEQIEDILSNSQR